jgi:hypothetical protein
VAATLAVPPSVFAEVSSAPNARMLAAVVREHAAQQDQDRRTIRQALMRPEVREMAERVGVDVKRLSSSVDTLANGELTQAAQRARQVNARLDRTSPDGGSNVTTSTAAIIVALLIAFVLISATR